MSLSSGTFRRGEGLHGSSAAISRASRYPQPNEVVQRAMEGIVHTAQNLMDSILPLLDKKQLITSSYGMSRYACFRCMVLKALAMRKGDKMLATVPAN